MHKEKKRAPKAETAALLPIAFKKACQLVKQGTRVTAAIKGSGMSEKSFNRYATEEMKKELHRLAAENKSFDGDDD